MIPSISASKASSQYSNTVFGRSEMTPIDGDKCTHFFHAHAKVTYARSKMHSLDMDGVTVLNEDYCSVLGVSKNARKSEIKVVIVLEYDFSFLGLWVGDWRKYYGGICFAPVLKEPGAEQKFKEISNAYEVLSDDEYYSLVINFKEAVFGVEKEIEVTRLGSCGTCDGSGAKPGPKPIHKAKKAYP
ncbi:hypothetical protein Patl1_35188 [Pistacia atlantica]|uniref:Uncharacterized protein n=1 Tax=Pistacia atlantica TaxID=434234 RepID=A0ACC0ZNU8_9ROSI|nr:hypothetical protein Patl1_35188 [Pistacia atlantica]